MATKTITLTGAEVAVSGLDGANAHIRNDGSATIYAAKAAGVTAGADGVLSIPAGTSATVNSISGAVYLLGTGSAQIVSNDYTESPFKSAVTLGSVTEEISRAVSNPNHIINSNFRINQRGKTEYTGSGTYSVDMWKCKNDAVITPIDDGIKVGLISGALSTNVADAQQIIENYADFSGKTCTVSVNVSDLSAAGAKVLVRVNDSSGNIQFPAVKDITSAGITSVTFDVPDDITYMDVWIRGADMRITGETADSYTLFRWAKLEIGSIATPFVPPDPATELAKCQRYYQIRSTNNIDPVDLRPSMAAIKDIKQRSDGNYEYIAE